MTNKIIITLLYRTNSARRAGRGECVGVPGLWRPPPPASVVPGDRGGGVAFLLKRIDGLGLPNMFCIEFQGVT